MTLSTSLSSVGNEQLLGMLKTAVILLDQSFTVVYVNDAALALLETGRTHIKDKPLYEHFIDDGFDKVRFHKAMRASEDFTETEVSLCFKDGRTLLTDITASFLEHNGLTHMLLEIVHIDKQRKITQESLHYAQQKAARDLIRGLAHEIKNPLGGIRGAAQLLEKELLDESQTEYTQMIVDQADRLRKLVDRLLGPNALPKKRWMNIHEVTEKVRSVIKLDDSLAVSIVRDYDPSLPDIYADPDMLEQVLLNIARNAMQAMQEAETLEPEIGIHTRIARKTVIKGEQHNLALAITITDNGPGIPVHIRDTIFYPMVSSKQEGSGLGLSIAQTLVAHHDGKLELESHSGFTQFHVYLPLSLANTGQQNA